MSYLIFFFFFFFFALGGQVALLVVKQIEIMASFKCSNENTVVIKSFL